MTARDDKRDEVRRHERRVVGHASGWQEQMDTCVCGKPWPCASVASTTPRRGETPHTEALRYLCRTCIPSSMEAMEKALDACAEMELEVLSRRKEAIAMTGLLAKARAERDSALSATARSDTWGDLLLASEGVRAPVLQFAVLMERKLKANDHKGTWEHCDLPYLIRRLKQEVMELERVVFTGDRNPEEIGGEAADVANFAMMLADNLSALPAGAPNNRPDGGKQT